MENIEKEEPYLANFPSLKVGKYSRLNEETQYCLRLLAGGMSYPEIAKANGAAEGTTNARIRGRNIELTAYY